MTKVSQNIDSSKSVLTLEQKKELEKQKRLIDRALVAKTLADKAEKFHSPYKITVSEALATDFLQKNRIAALRIYLLIRRDFSGKFHYSKLGELARVAEKCETYCRRTLHQLCEMGYLEQKPSGWLFCLGTKRFNIANGMMHPRMCRVPETALKSPKHLRTFIYSCLISRASKNANRKPQRYHELSAGQVENGTSISYLSKYLGVSTFTACKHRKRASDYKMIKVRPDFRLLAEGSAAEIKMWKENCPFFYRCIIERPKPGHFQLLERLPSKIEIGVFSKRRKLHYSDEQKQSILNRYTPNHYPILTKHRHGERIIGNTLN